ncbi:FISUMP domain-containing protein, partial [Fibrobacter sp. UWH1]|uniref:FISUMP domain-containing protein n=1 Tax=Fibrobacter sp. UWH1 TaxID=1964354 RepID=UPI000B6C487A
GSSHMSSSTPIEDLDESSSSINDNSSSSVIPGSSSSVIPSDSEDSNSSSSVKADGKSSSSINKEGSSSSTKVDVYSSSSDDIIDIGNSSSSVSEACKYDLEGECDVFAWVNNRCGVLIVDGNKYFCSELDNQWHKSVSSSSAKSSSSSKAVSSSSVYFSFRDKVYSYSDLTDERDGRVYKIYEVTGRDTNKVEQTITVMAQNLNYAEKIVSGADEQDDNTKVEKYCYNNDTLMCSQYGGLYQWAEMMDLPYECNEKSCASQIKTQHQGICPNGWHLMTRNEFNIVYCSGRLCDIGAVKSETHWNSSDGTNKTGFTMLPGGMMSSLTNEFTDLKEAAYYYFPEEYLEKEGWARGLNIYARNQNVTFYVTGYKITGKSIRCVQNY